MPDKIPENSAVDELERIAQQGDLDKLNECLKTHTVWIPRRPRRFLDPAGLKKEQLLEMVKKDAEEMSQTPFEPWILELDGKKRLPVFSSKQRMHAFSKQISMKMNQIFSLGGIEILLEHVLKQVDVDFVDLNLFSENSREIGVRRRAGWISSLRRIAGLGS